MSKKNDGKKPDKRAIAAGRRTAAAQSNAQNKSAHVSYANRSAKPSLSDPAGVLVSLRFLWIVLFMSQLMFGSVVSLMIAENRVTPNLDMAQVFFLVSFWGFLVGMPIAYFIRHQTYKRHWVADRVTPFGYFIGNAILLSVCEGLCMLGLVGVLMTGDFWMRSNAMGQSLPFIMPALMALAVLVVNFPNGGMMQPKPPELLRP